MQRPDTEFQLTVEKVLPRDRETDEEKLGWQVTSEHLPRPCQDEDPADALRLLVECLDIEGRVTIEELAGEEV